MRRYAARLPAELAHFDRRGVARETDERGATDDNRGVLPASRAVAERPRIGSPAVPAEPLPIDGALHGLNSSASGTRDRSGIPFTARAVATAGLRLVRHPNGTSTGIACRQDDPPGTLVHESVGQILHRHRYVPVSPFEDSRLFEECEFETPLGERHGCDFSHDLNKALHRDLRRDRVDEPGDLSNPGLLRRLRHRGLLRARATDRGPHGPQIADRTPRRLFTHRDRGPDAKTVLPDLDVVTIAAKGAHTQTHNHYWTLQLTRRASRDEVLDALRAAPRIAFIRMSDGLVALNSTVELMRDLGRPRGDMWEVAVWEDLVTVDGDEAYLTYQVCNEAIVIPETVDAIRALTGTVTDPAASIRLTDATLGMRQDFLAPERS